MLSTCQFHDRLVLIYFKSCDSKCILFIYPYPTTGFALALGRYATTADSTSAARFSALYGWPRSKDCNYPKLYFVSNNPDSSSSLFIIESNSCWVLEQQLQYADSHSVTYSWEHDGQEHPMLYWDQHTIKRLFACKPYFYQIYKYSFRASEFRQVRTLLLSCLRKINLHSLMLSSYPWCLARLCSSNSPGVPNSWAHTSHFEIVADIQTW